MTETNIHKKAAETVSFSSRVSSIVSWFYTFLHGKNSLYLLLHFNVRRPRQPLPIFVFMLASPLPGQSQAIVDPLIGWEGWNVKREMAFAFQSPQKILNFLKGEKMVLKLFLKGCGNIRKLFRNENQPSETASNSRMKIKWRRNYRKFEYSSKDCLVSFGNFQTISESSKWKGRIEKRPGTILNHI